VNPYLAIIVLAVALAGCGTGIAVPRDAAVRYQDRVAGTTVAVSDPLASRIRETLAGEPDSADPGKGMGLDTLHYCRVGDLIFQVMGDRLILLDDWGVRTWIIDRVGAELAELEAP